MTRLRTNSTDSLESKLRTLGKQWNFLIQLLTVDLLAIADHTIGP